MLSTQLTLLTMAACPVESVLYEVQQSVLLVADMRMQQSNCLLQRFLATVVVFVAPNIASCSCDPATDECSCGMGAIRHLPMDPICSTEVATQHVQAKVAFDRCHRDSHEENQQPSPQAPAGT